MTNNITIIILLILILNFLYIASFIFSQNKTTKKKITAGIINLIIIGFINFHHQHKQTPL